MSFSENLMRLRKQKGLSQEELANEIDVSRQTVSKWELGTSTPEMEKLIQIANFFGISVDNLVNSEDATSNVNINYNNNSNSNINENQNTNFNDQTINNESSSANNHYNSNSDYTSASNKKTGVLAKVYVTLMVFAILAILGILIYMLIRDVQDKKNNNSTINQNNTNAFVENNINSTVEQNIINTAENNTANNIENNAANNTENNITNNTVNNTTNNKSDYISVFAFNMYYYNGSCRGSSVGWMLDHAITSNKTNERKITVKYNETETSDVEEIKGIKSQLGSHTNYEVDLDYDSDGYVYLFTINNI